jgi:cell division protein FtsB
MASQHVGTAALCVLLLGASALSACDQAELQGQRNKLQELSKTLEATNEQLERVSQRVTQLETQLALDQLARDRYRNAIFDPGEKGFSRLDTSIGSFAISLQDVTSYADGVRVRLHIGNLTTATVNGGTFKAKWGPRGPSYEDKDYLAKYNQWAKSLREKTIDFQDELRSGTWNNVALVLPGVPPDRFGYLELSLETSRISLLRVP